MSLFEANVTPLCDKDEDLDDEIKLERIGRDMNASHISCRDLYDCSCPELEELVNSELIPGKTTISPLSCRLPPVIRLEPSAVD